MWIQIKKRVGMLLSLGLLLHPGYSQALGVGSVAPKISSAVWINSPPLDLQALKGRVVMVEFWTFGCSNCRNVEPYVKQWHEKYVAQGLTIIGVHAPEFDYESRIDAVKDYVRTQNIRHAVALDNDFAIWKRYQNRFWPSLYLIDKKGIVRYTHIGEGQYTTTEAQIQALLAEP